MHKLTYLLLGCCFAESVFAERVLPIDNRRFDEHHQPLPDLQAAPVSDVPEPHSSFSTSPLRLTKAELQQQPELLFRLLVEALTNNDAALVASLTPLYQTQPNADVQLLQWSEALLAANQKQFGKAISYYEKVLAAKPEAQAVRFQLAIAQFKQRHNQESKSQFEWLSQQHLPVPLTQLAQYYLAQLASQDTWQFHFSSNYLKESNVNNAPKAGTVAEGFTPSSQPQSAEGVGYQFNLSKNWALPKGFFTRFSGDLYGKYYWQNGKYDEFTARGQLGLGYRHHLGEITLLPFAEQYWFAGGEKARENHRLQRYSKQFGAELAASYWLNPRWKVATLFEYAEQRYQPAHRQLSNGNHYAWSNTLSFFPSNERLWFFGADYYRQNARWKANGFDRYGLRAGWSQQWQNGLVSQLQLNYARRLYHMAAAKPESIFAPSFFKVAQKNHEYGIAFTLWHRQLQWKGITPKVTWSYQNIHSNNPFAVYDRHRVYLTLSKGF